MKAHHTIIKDINLIIEVYEGVITIDDILNNLKNIFDDPDYSSHYNFLVDLRRASMVYSINDYKILFKTIENSPQGYSRHLTALLTATPEQTTTSMLIVFNEMPKDFKDSVFTTLSGSMNYLGIDLKHRDLIISEIDKLASEK